MKEKLLSGRWIFTMVTALVFGWSAFTKILNNEQIVSIITLVLAFYFTKDRKEQ